MKRWLVIFVAAFLISPGISFPQKLKPKEIGTFRGQGRSNTRPFFSQGVLVISYNFKTDGPYSFSITVRDPTSGGLKDYAVSIEGSRNGRTYYYGKGAVYLSISGVGEWAVTVHTLPLFKKGLKPGKTNL